MDCTTSALVLQTIALPKSQSTIKEARPAAKIQIPQSKARNVDFHSARRKKKTQFYQSIKVETKPEPWKVAESWKGMQAFLSSKEAKLESRKISNPSPADHKEQIYRPTRTYNFILKNIAKVCVSVEIKSPNTQPGQGKKQ
ncbi:unnamed protein product [Dovyalis caffra]|uniref:Uncharacterized protein n=1 Tax=Dovyalis caffra TaxID=77055 RepID=A0AAV1RBH5_9ROSI|nr:unnamed protein product [Dovyalis caffra]